MWVGDEKIAAIGVKVARGRTRHGFALNVDPDLAMFDHIVPCGIRDRGVTSMAAVLGEAPEMRAVVDAVVAQFAARFGATSVERQDVVWREHPDDLSAFTRAAMAGGDAQSDAAGKASATCVERRAGAAPRSPGRGRGAGVGRRPRHPSSRSGCG